MIVIGLGASDEYICKIKHSELEKYFNLYYNKMNRLKVGDTVDLGTGHDFASDTRRALQTTEEFIKDHKKIIDTIMQGFCVLGNLNQNQKED